MINTCKICLLLISVITFSSCIRQKEKNWILNSPDGKFNFLSRLNDSSKQEPVLQYMVATIENGKPAAIIESSPLGIIREDQAFSDNLSFVSKSELKTIDEKYTMLIGSKAKSATMQMNLNSLLKTGRVRLFNWY